MHRIGRTGRAGKEGIATSFLTAEDTDIMPDLKKVLLSAEAKIPPELMQYDPNKQDRKKPRHGR